MASKNNMTKKELAEIKKKLLAEKTHLENELSKFAKKNPHSDDDYEAQFVEIGSDETENVSEVEQYSLDKSLELTLEKSLRDINKALDNIKKGSYGLCKYCKQPINPKRLKARPTSSSCITCKTKLKSL